MKSHHIYIIFICLTVLLLPAHSQVGEPRNDWAIGVNGGFNFNRVSFYPSVNQKWYFGPTYGVTARYTCEKYFAVLCAFQAEANYSRLGWKEDILTAAGKPSSETYKRTLHYVQVPLLARLGVGREKRGVMGYIVLGPQLGYLLGESAEHSTNWNPADRVNSRNEQYDLTVKNRFDYGITGGLGLELGTPAGHFLIEGRYYFGLSNLFGASKKDPFGRSANGAIVGKISYLIPL